MKIYTYEADTWCQYCAERIKEEAECPGDPEDPYSYDSEHYPKGPDTHEADTPLHCAGCGVFLQNSLTDEGYRYLAERAHENPESDTVQTWVEYYYDISLFQETDQAVLEGPYECPRCGGHLTVDATYLDQASPYIHCPYCQHKGVV